MTIAGIYPGEINPASSPDNTVPVPINVGKATADAKFFPGTPGAYNASATVTPALTQPPVQPFAQQITTSVTPYTVAAQQYTRYALTPGNAPVQPGFFVPLITSSPQPVTPQPVVISEALLPNRIDTTPRALFTATAAIPITPQPVTVTLGWKPNLVDTTLGQPVITSTAIPITPPPTSVTLGWFPNTSDTTRGAPFITSEAKPVTPQPIRVQLGLLPGTPPPPTPTPVIITALAKVIPLPTATVQLGLLPGLAPASAPALVRPLCATVVNNQRVAALINQARAATVSNNERVATVVDRARKSTLLNPERSTK